MNPSFQLIPEQASTTAVHLDHLTYLPADRRDDLQHL